MSNNLSHHKIWDIINFCKVIYRQAIFSENMVEMPMVNLLKMHGSVTWQLHDEELSYCNYSQQIQAFSDRYKNLFSNQSCQKMEEIITSDITVSEKYTQLETVLSRKRCSAKYDDFLADYIDSFVIVNPTKEKFRTTVMKTFYHEILRMYSNELEKQNTLLIAFGFSFRDEHILEITRRSLINPSLLLYAFCYDDETFDDLKRKFSHLKHANVFLVKMKDEKLGLLEFNNILHAVFAGGK